MAWLDTQVDVPPRRALHTPDDEEFVALRDWQRRLALAGYAGVTWPQEYGGAGLGLAEQMIVDQELEARGIAPPFDFIGLKMIGPALLTCGSPEQRARYLGPMLTAEEIWCQLFSEPGAGSDLAGLRTRARRMDDGSWRVDGQKVWTTHAHWASFGVLLARTDPDAPRHRGLTMFIVPMDAPGIDIRPLRQTSGEVEFNEVYFDDVTLPADSVIGEPGAGWKVALTMLGFERLSVGSGSHVTSLDRLTSLLARCDAHERADLMVRFGRVATEILGLRYTNYRLMTAIGRGQIPGPEAGLAKITTVLASLEACRLAADAGGVETLDDPEWGGQIAALPGLRSAGGTEEILRNIIGERVLGLPVSQKA